jgi:protein-disulfide isomerase
MLNGRDVALSGACSAPVDQWLAVGRKFGVRATPTSFAANGQRIMGARPEELVKLIDEARK